MSSAVISPTAYCYVPGQTLPTSWAVSQDTGRLRSWRSLGRMTLVPTTAVSISGMGVKGNRVQQAYDTDPVSQCQQPSTPLGQQLLDGEALLEVNV